MKFVDYYKILDIPIDSTLDEIKEAFKKQALKWHPDKNPNEDTTEKMQLINEAYLILKDKEARERYDQEYKKHQTKNTYNLNKNRSPGSTSYGENHESCNYVVEDEILQKWMNNAKSQAIDLAIKTINDLRGMSKAGAKAAIEEVKTGLQMWFILIVFVAIIYLILAIYSK